MDNAGNFRKLNLKENEKIRKKRKKSNKEKKFESILEALLKNLNDIPSVKLASCSTYNLSLGGCE